MWMKVLGRIRLAVKLIAVLALVSLGLALASAGAEEAPSKPAPPPEPQATEIIFAGKVFCSLKRPVLLDFPGLIKTLRVQAGQQVKAGEVLARYRLSPEARLELQRRLSPPQIKDLEVKLAAVEKNLAELESKRRSIKQLKQEKLASDQSLQQIQREVGLLAKQRRAVQQSLRLERQLAKEDRDFLTSKLGKSLKPGHLPQEAALVAPISGYVIWVDPALRDGAELKAKGPVLQVGLMDPMIIRARVHEIEAMQLKLGDRAEVTIGSLPGRTFEALVSRLPWASAVSAPEEPSYYDVEFSVANPDLLLKEGLKARLVLPKLH